MNEWDILGIKIILLYVVFVGIPIIVAGYLGYKKDQKVKDLNEKANTDYSTYRGC
jgi:hypothetical protein